MVAPSLQLFRSAETQLHNWSGDACSSRSRKWKGKFVGCTIDASPSRCATIM
jgi:hypothetical protein